MFYKGVYSFHTNWNSATDMDTIISTTMAQTSYPPTSVSVVSPNFLVPNRLKLTVVKDLWSLFNGNFAVTDGKGNLMFKVRSKPFSLCYRRVLLDASDTPILSIQRKLLSFYNRWVVFWGDSSRTEDIIFSVRNSSSLFKFKSPVHVFLGCNKKEQVWDFKARAAVMGDQATIYAGDTTNKSNTILAQMHKKHTFQSMFSVTVNPNVDYAFIVALAVILHEINEEKEHEQTRLRVRSATKYD